MRSFKYFQQERRTRQQRPRSLARRSFRWQPWRPWHVVRSWRVLQRSRWISFWRWIPRRPRRWWWWHWWRQRSWSRWASPFVTLSSSTGRFGPIDGCRGDLENASCAGVRDEGERLSRATRSCYASHRKQKDERIGWLDAVGFEQVTWQCRSQGTCGRISWSKQNRQHGLRVKPTEMCPSSGKFDFLVKELCRERLNWLAWYLLLSTRSVQKNCSNK